MVAGAARQTYSMIDPDSRPAYTLIASAFAVSIVTVGALGFSLSNEALAIFWTWPFVAVGGLLARRIGRPRLALVMEGGALLYGQGLCLLLFLYGMAAIGGP